MKFNQNILLQIVSLKVINGHQEPVKEGFAKVYKINSRNMLQEIVEVEPLWQTPIA